MMFDQLQFPTLPDYSAQFCTIYFEPIVASGERFAVGVMVKADSGEHKVLQTISDKTLQCMYGNNAASVKSFVAMILESAVAHLSAGHDLSEWQAPVNGVYLSGIKQTRSSAGMDGVLFQAVTQHASLYKGNLIENALAEIGGIEATIAEEAEAKTATLIQQVKQIYIGSGRTGDHWQREVMVKACGKISIDYLGPYYNANLSNFDVRFIKPAYNAAKAKLFDLDVLRNKRQHESIEMTQRFELLVSLKKRASAEAKEHYEMLEQLADSIELCVVKKATPQELAERIIKLDQAA